jgi:hypothetical protein
MNWAMISKNWPPCDVPSGQHHVKLRDARI